MVRLATAVAVCAAVAALLLWLSSFNYVTPPIDSYALSNDERQIELSFDGGIGDVIAETHVSEEEDRVVVSVRLRQTVTRKISIGIPMHATVNLQRPLGSRRVVDSTGRTIPRSE